MKGLYNFAKKDLYSLFEIVDVYFTFANQDKSDNLYLISKSN